MKISRSLGYSFDEILNHNSEWVNQVAKEIMRQEFEDRTIQMALHGVPKKEIGSMRRRFYREMERSDENKDRIIPISEFQGQGIMIGKDTGTRFVRGGKKK